MKISLGTGMAGFASLAGLASLMSIASAQATLSDTTAVAAADPCTDALNPTGWSKLLKSLITTNKSVRVRATCELREALLNNYSLIDQKERRLKAAGGAPFSSRALLQHCAQIEADTDDSSDLHYIDRLQQCIAGFHDTHLSLDGRIPLPAVSAGIIARSIEGRMTIVAVRQDVLDYVKQSTDFGSAPGFDDAFAIGNEVLEVDGQAPAQLAAHYATYINGSSDDYVKLISERALFTRWFDYPTQNSVRIKIRSPQKTYEVALPWWASADAKQREDAMAYFKKVGIPLTDRIAIEHSADGKLDWRKYQLKYTGFLDSNPLFADPFAPLLTLNDEKGVPAARLGQVNAAGGAHFCYLQLLTFEPEQFFQGTQSTDFIDALRAFVGDCKLHGLDLVFDLRQNGGGIGSYPARILSLLMPAGTVFGGKVIAYRATPAIGRLVSSLVDHPELATGDLTDVNSRAADALELALDSGSPFTAAIPWGDVTADPGVQGYSGKVIELVTPSCISACDGMSALLKRSGRATLIGTHSNGTGAGFMSSDTIGSSFSDSNNEYTVNIPDYLFGYSSRPLGSLSSLPYLEHEEEFFTENRPASAQVQFEPSLEDVQGRRKGWEDAVLKALKAAD